MPPLTSTRRRPVYFNPEAKSWTAAEEKHTSDALNFHKQLPEYQPTPLIPLTDAAAEIGVKAVYVKNESNRFGLPAFKILGASWGTYRAVISNLGLPIDAKVDDVRKAASTSGIKLFAATDGNHGRAVARMGSILGVPAEIHIPKHLHQATVEFIISEGAEIVRSAGIYDDAIASATEAARIEPNGILVQDFAFDEYMDIPKWIVEGYKTMLVEVDQLLDQVDVVICPVGVGSFAQAVVSHFKQAGRKTAVVGVEPDTAPCLWKSLKEDKLVTVDATPTIMSGLECGRVSESAWPILRSGIDACLTVSDYESHNSTLEMQQSSGTSCGPCGGATLAALRRLTSEELKTLGVTKDSTVLLLCTEGSREYDLPHDVSISDPVVLTQKLISINSASPSLGSVPGPGETAIARYISAWLEHRDIDSHWLEPTPGRPSVIGVVRGSGDGKSLMLNGHMDTVTLQGYDGDPLQGEIRDGKLYGRGAADMKCGLAAAMVALAETKARDVRLRGDVILACVADEEDTSMGTEQVLQAGWRADAAVVNEPTDLNIIHQHKGFVWVEVSIHGTAYHGSRADKGVDAISKAGYFLAELDRYAKKLLGDGDDIEGRPSVHASMIKGGEEASSYPALCTVVIEYRTVEGQTAATVKAEMASLIDAAAKNDPLFRADVRVTFERPPFSTPKDGTFATLVGDHVGQALGKEPSFQRIAFWTDAALLADAGIEALLWGPTGGGLHAKEEWVDVESIGVVATTLAKIAADFCA